jgi:carbohydrate-binding DOMON domain-containing protein
MYGKYSLTILAAACLIVFAAFGQSSLNGVANQQVVYAIRTVTASDTSTTADYTMLCDTTTANMTETLPASPLTGEIMYVKKIDATSHTCTVSGNGSNIDGSATAAIITPNASIEIQYDGTVWRIL